MERGGFAPWVGKIPLEKGNGSRVVSLPGESRGQEPGGATVHGVAKGSDTTEPLSPHARVSPRWADRASVFPVDVRALAASWPSCAHTALLLGCCAWPAGRGGGIVRPGLLPAPVCPSSVPLPFFCSLSLSLLTRASSQSNRPKKKKKIPSHAPQPRKSRSETQD